MEILGISGKQSDFREDRIDKKTHPGFIELRTQNRFLGSGDQYLRSDQIIRVGVFWQIGFLFISSGSRDCELPLQVQDQLSQSSGLQDHGQTDLTWWLFQQAFIFLLQQL